MCKELFFKPGRLIHHLSLDAPLIAIIWKTFISMGLNNKIFFAETLILGTAVWLAYSADRFFEPIDINNISPSRFQIGGAHPIRFVVGWVLVLIAIIIYSISILDLFILSAGFGLFILAMSNFLICMLEGKRKQKLYLLD